MLPTPTSRERALAVAAAVMMIEPTLHNPRSEIIEFLIGTLGVDPTRVMDMACQLTGTFEVAPKAPAKPPAKKSPAKKAAAPAPAKIALFQIEELFILA